MFEKLRIAYSREEIFGKHFKPSINDSYCMTAKMFFNNKINIDGSIELTKENNFKKEELWSYLYYLYYYNHSTIPTFIEVIDKSKYKSSALKFYNIISKIFNINDNVSKSAKPLENIILIKFINYIIKEYSKDLINPIFDYINILIKTNNMKLKNLNIKGDKIITDEEKLKNANIIVKLINNTNNTKINEEKNKLFQDENNKFQDTKTENNPKSTYSKFTDLFSSNSNKTIYNNKTPLEIEIKYDKYIRNNIPHKEMEAHINYLKSKLGDQILVNKYHKNQKTFIKVLISKNMQLSSVLNKLKNKYIKDIIVLDNKKINAICKLPHYKNYRRIHIKLKDM